MENTSVYTKLNICRLAFKNSKIKKSGKNSFAGYDYFELDDILNAIIPICNDNKCVTVVNFSAETATLNFIDCETGNGIVFTSPMSTASLKGCHDVQNLGAVESYIKRYLYQNCFEIAEPDQCDRTMNPNETPRKAAPQPKQHVEGDSEEESAAKKFENFVVKYCNKDAKATLSILKSFGFSTPQEVPAEKRHEIGMKIKETIKL